MHGAASGSLAFILPRLVRQIYQDSDPEDGDRWLWTACILLAFFFVFRPVLTPWSRQTHYTTLVTPFLALAVLFLHQKLWWPLVICCVIICSGQERASISLFSLGMYAALLLNNRRVAISLCLASVLWFFTVTQLWLPWMRELADLQHGYAFEKFLAPASHIKEKLRYVWSLFLYTCFLPLCGKRALLCFFCVMPFVALMVASNYQMMWSFTGQYEDLPGIFILLSCGYGLRFWQQKLRPAIFKKCFLFLCPVVVVLILATQTGYYNPLMTSIRLLTSPERDAAALLRDDLARLPRLPDTLLIWVQSGLGPHLFYPKERYTADISRLPTVMENTLILLSPLVGTFRLTGRATGGRDPQAYATARTFFDAHPDLLLLKDTGVLVIYGSRDLPCTHPSLVKRLRE